DHDIELLVAAELRQPLEDIRADEAVLAAVVDMMRGREVERALRLIDMRDVRGARMLGGAAEHPGVREQVEHARACERGGCEVAAEAAKIEVGAGLVALGEV